MRIRQTVTFDIELEVDASRRDADADELVDSGLTIGFGADWSSVVLGEYTEVEG